MHHGNIPHCTLFQSTLLRNKLSSPAHLPYSWHIGATCFHLLPLARARAALASLLPFSLSTLQHAFHFALPMSLASTYPSAVARGLDRAPMIFLCVYPLQNRSPRASSLPPLCPLPSTVTPPRPPPRHVLRRPAAPRQRLLSPPRVPGDVHIPRVQPGQLFRELLRPLCVCQPALPVRFPPPDESSAPTRDQPQRCAWCPCTPSTRSRCPSPR